MSELNLKCKVTNKKYDILSNIFNKDNIDFHQFVAQKGINIITNGIKEIIEDEIFIESNDENIFKVFTFLFNIKIHYFNGKEILNYNGRYVSIKVNDFLVNKTHTCFSVKISY